MTVGAGTSVPDRHLQDAGDRIAGMKYIVTAAFAALIAAPAGAQTCDLSMASGVSLQELTSGQRPRTYRLFVPPGYDGRTRLPLVLDLHGSGGNAAKRSRRLTGFSRMTISSPRRKI